MTYGWDIKAELIIIYSIPNHNMEKDPSWCCILYTNDYEVHVLLGKVGRTILSSGLLVNCFTFFVHIPFKFLSSLCCSEMACLFFLSHCRWYYYRYYAFTCALLFGEIQHLFCAKTYVKLVSLDHVIRNLPSPS